MFTQKRLNNLKFVYIVLFSIIVLFGGFFISTKNVNAAGTTITTVTYSLSEVTNITNSDGSITTKIMVGCAPGSGDKYDINTGRLCTYYTPPKILLGCAPGSGDKYDINTGKLCTNYKPTILTGCAPNSGDIYDINTGKRCTNDTSTKSLAVTSLLKDPNKQIVANELALVTTKPIETISKNEITVNNNEDNIPGRKILANNISASVGKIGSVFSGPMSFWVILLLIAILLGGGYGIYSFKNKNKQIPEETKQVISHVAPIVKNEVKQQEIPLNNVPPTTQTNSHIPQSNTIK